MAKLRKLGRPTDQRKALLRALTTDFLKHGKIETTFHKAKEAQRMAEKMITLGKKGDLHSRRRAAAYVYDKDVVKDLFENIAPKYAERKGGYTRIYKMGPRRGDGAERAILELV